MNVSVPLPSRMSAGDRKRQLIETAIDLFAEKGFSGTKTKEIAAKAGVTEAIVFRHFATKRDLYSAILNHIQAGPLSDQFLAEAQGLMEQRDDAGLIRLLVERIVSSIAREPRFERLMMLASMEGHEFARIHMREFAFPIGEKLCAYFAMRQADGAVENGSPRSILLLIAGAANFYAMHKYIYSLEALTCDSEERVIEDLIRFLTKALLRNGHESRN